MPGYYKIVSASGQEIYVSEEAMKFLQELTPKKIEELEEAIDLAHDVKRMASAFKIVVLLGLGILASIMTVWNNWLNIKNH